MKKMCGEGMKNKEERGEQQITGDQQCKKQKRGKRGEMQKKTIIVQRRVSGLHVRQVSKGNIATLDEKRARAKMLPMLQRMQKTMKGVY